jgi:hypothetical protein
VKNEVNKEEKIKTKNAERDAAAYSFALKI